jgi:hypothetical protein
VPEALWLTFHVPAAKASSWVLDKLGVPVSPLDIVPGGGRLHAVERGVLYADKGRELVEMLDTPIVSPFGPCLLRFENRSPADEDCIAVCLLNNVWGTNFAMWYGESGQARFVIRVADEAARFWSTSDP